MYSCLHVRESNSHRLLQSHAERCDRRRRLKTFLLETTPGVAAEPHRHVDDHPQLCLALSFAADGSANIICPDRSPAKKGANRWFRTRNRG